MTCAHAVFYKAI